ncbi:MAG: Trk system potassium transporter TrkA, partial [Oscillospiraceae bacterium]|nr:Trk system potassium transporter TrkA [Oscillospiraceae bacterium]
MKIVIVGCGKVGFALAKQLSDEGHDITVVDTNAERIERITETLDVMGYVGNGTSVSLFQELDIDNVDVFVAVTGSDELNLLCCMFAKKTSNCHVIARVRNPVYSHEIDFIKQQMGISVIINPELAAAREIFSLLRFPGAEQIDTFADGRVHLIKFELKESYGLDGVLLKDISAILGTDILICAVERGQSVVIPGGNFALHSGDLVTFLSTHEKTVKFFHKLKLQTRPVKNTLIVGGGTIGYYLAQDLIKHGIHVRIIDKDPERCRTLAEALPEATILNGDGTDRQFLLAEGLELTESFVSLTNVDEENVLLTLFAKKHCHGKMITKVNRLEFDDILDGLDVGSVVYPKYLTCDFILQNVRALRNKAGSNVKTLYHILDNRVEALEFTVHEDSAATRE